MYMYKQCRARDSNNFFHDSTARTNVLPMSGNPVCFILFVMLSESPSVVMRTRLSPRLDGCADTASLSLPWFGMIVLRQMADSTGPAPSCKWRHHIIRWFVSIIPRHKSIQDICDRDVGEMHSTCISHLRCAWMMGDATYFLYCNVAISQLQSCSVTF